MKRLFKILQLLTEKKVTFCFQSQKWPFYNLMVVDIHNKSHYLSGDMDTVSRGLNVIWGHLIDGTPAKEIPPKILAPTNTMPPIPAPVPPRPLITGMPKP